MINRNRFVPSIAIGAMIAIASVAATPCLAQSSSNNSDKPLLIAASEAPSSSSSVTDASSSTAQPSAAPAPPQASPSTGATPTTEELEALKKRIDVLEADLKARNVVAPGDEDPNSNKEPIAPFSDADWTWLMGNPRNHDTPMATKHFIPEIRADINYNLDFNHPVDDVISGSSEIFRSQEFQVEQLGLGGDFYLSNVHARFMTQFGMYSVTTPRNDGSQGRGQWNLADAYRYVSEAYGGYHINHLHGVNIDAGIFMSYIGLFGYYNFDNWAYQPSFVSSNTPWFFNGLRLQFFPTPHLKIEPWFINGWQSYGRFNSKPGLGGQIKYNPVSWVNIISNNYGYGEDDYGVANRSRIHTDNSVEFKYFEHPTKFLDRMAISLTGDAGCEFGNSYPEVVNTVATPTLPVGAITRNAQVGVSCHGNTKQAGQINPKQSFIGYMVYQRAWFNHDRQAFTIGGGQINNPGRYLVLTPVINGATALTGTPYFTQNPGDPFVASDFTATYDYMPRQYLTYRAEYGYRHANQAYWNGRGGMTPPGGTQASPVGNPGDYTCTNGQTSFDAGFGYSYGPGNTQASNLANAKSYCLAQGGGNYLWQPDLRKDEQKLTFAILVKF